MKPWLKALLIVVAAVIVLGLVAAGAYGIGYRRGMAGNFFSSLPQMNRQPLAPSPSNGQASPRGWFGGGRSGGNRMPYMMMSPRFNRGGGFLSFWHHPVGWLIGLLFVGLLIFLLVKAYNKPSAPAGGSRAPARRPTRSRK